MEHHYIPQFYLRLFVPKGKGLIWVYRKGCKTRERSIRKTAYQRLFYAFTDISGNYHQCDVERELNLIEHRTSQVLYKTVFQHLPIGDNDKATLARFLVSLQRRTPKNRIETIGRSVQVFYDFLNNMESNYKTSLETEEFERLWPRMQHLRDKLLAKHPEVPEFLIAELPIQTSDVDEVLCGMDWAIFIAPEGTPFLTCDDPVLVSKGCGLLAHDGILIFPISSRYCLQIARSTSFLGNYVELKSADVRHLNQQIVRNALHEVYSGAHTDIIDRFVHKWLGKGYSRNTNPTRCVRNPCPTRTQRSPAPL